VDRARIESLLLDAFRQGASYDDVMKILLKELPITLVSIKCAGLDKQTHELNFQVTVRL